MHDTCIIKNVKMNEFYTLDPALGANQSMSLTKDSSLSALRLLYIRVHLE